MIHVVSAVLAVRGRVFLQQRPAGKDFGFCWETPGGKVDAGESRLQALRRELREELDVDIGNLRRQRGRSCTSKKEGSSSRPRSSAGVCYASAVFLRAIGHKTSASSTRARHGGSS